MSSNDAEAKLLRYLKALDAIRKEDNHYIRSILQVFNFARGPKERKPRLYQELAELMLDEGNCNRVLYLTEELLPPRTFSTFRLAIIGGTTPARSLVKDFLKKDSLPEECLFRPTSTLSDLIQFFQSSERSRYFMVINEGIGDLLGIVSIKDYLDNNDETERLTREGKLDTPAIKLRFFNSKPKTINENDTMDYAWQKFEEAEKKGQRFTALLVVDDTKHPVGLLDEPDLGRWRAGSREIRK